jgi:hypothetical protein
LPFAAGFNSRRCTSTAAAEPGSRDHAAEILTYAESLERLGNAREYRRIRLFQMNLQAPDFLWALRLIVGVMIPGLRGPPRRSKR